MPTKSLPHNFKDLTDQRFGRLVVKERAPSGPNWKTRWRCKCDCGNEIAVGARHLLSGKILSCKCLWENRTKHGATTHTTKSREYSAWIEAKTRCYNPNHIGYENWGGRGIRMWDGWVNNPEKFLSYMGKCPPGFQLDRYPNNDGHYEPGNVRWASRKEQNRNKRENSLITYQDKTKTIVEWAEESGLSYSTLWARLFVWHWPIEKALFARGKRPSK